MTDDGLKYYFSTFMSNTMVGRRGISGCRELLCQSGSKVNKNMVQAMLVMIHKMKFFLRMAYGDSSEFTGLTFHIKMQ